MSDETRLGMAQVDAEGLSDWRLVFDVLHARFETGDFAAGTALVTQIARAADEANHHPDLTLTYPRLDVRLTSHDVHGVTPRDVALARTISTLAAQAGAVARPDQVSVLELGLDTWDADEIKPFWAALLDHVDDPRGFGDVVDPDGVKPSIWFQQCERHDEPHQRWHLDLRVPPEVVEDRIAAAVRAGGRLVSADDAPAFWVLADPQGNRVCLTTGLGRD